MFSVGQYYLERHYARGSTAQPAADAVQRIKANLSTFRRPEVADDRLSRTARRRIDRRW